MLLFKSVAFAFGIKSTSVPDDILSYWTETLISGPSQALPISAICPKSIRRQLPNICLLTRAAGDSWSLNRDR